MGMGMENARLQHGVVVPQQKTEVASIPKFRHALLRKSGALGQCAPKPAHRCAQTGHSGVTYGLDQSQAQAEQRNPPN